MMLELKDIKTMHDKAYCSGQNIREMASEDKIFYWISQYDGEFSDFGDLLYRGQFDVTRKAGRSILSKMKANPVQIDYQPVDEEKNDGAELMDGIYRADDLNNSSVEAEDMAVQDQVVCGFGAWERYAEYRSSRSGDQTQVIKKRFIADAVNTVFFDPNDMSLDKSDSKYCSVLTAYTEEGYKDFVEDLTGERPDNVAESFAHPNESIGFHWWDDAEKRVYITNFYYVEEITERVYTFTGILGDSVTYTESNLEDTYDEVLSQGYEMESSREITRNQVTLYIASGVEILDSSVIPGEFIPVTPVYGERSIVEGVEHYEGFVRLTKDPQRLRNFQLSYLADICSKSPVVRPIYLAEQLEGHETMYSENGADEQYAYRLQNRVDAAGNDLPLGPVGLTPETPMPKALAVGLEMTRQAIEDVAGTGLPQDIADPDLSGKAVMALQGMWDNQSYVYQHHLKFAKRRDAMIYASMAREVMDTERTVTIANPDGTTQKAELMRRVYDDESGEFVIMNDLTDTEFDVYAEIGPEYSSVKEQTQQQLSEMAAAMAPIDPAMSKMLMLKQAELIGGVNMDDVRDYANKQLVLAGFKEPQTEEEEALLQQASQENAEPDPNELLGKAEMLKGQAAVMREQTNQFKAQADAANNAAGNMIDREKLQNDRAQLQIDAHEVGAKIENTNADTRNKQLDAALKLEQAQMARIASMSDRELLRLASG